MARPIDDAVEILEVMMKVLKPGRVLSQSEAARRDAVLKSQSNKLNLIHAVIEQSLSNAIADVNAQARALSVLKHDLDAMLRAINWLNSVRKLDGVSDPGAVVHNAKAMMVMSSNDLRKSFDGFKEVSGHLDDLGKTLGL